MVRSPRLTCFLSILDSISCQSSIIYIVFCASPSINAIQKSIRENVDATSENWLLFKSNEMKVVQFCRKGETFNRINVIEPLPLSQKHQRKKKHFFTHRNWRVSMNSEAALVCGSYLQYSRFKTS